MKRSLLAGVMGLAVLVMVWGGIGVVYADPVLYVDSAPNVYGSPDWGPWWAATKSDVASGSFTNMRSGVYPGTTMISPYDEIVYSTMDLGRRLHWIYWLPGETTGGLAGRFEVKWVIDWGGTDWTWDWNTMSWTLDDPNAGWVQPGSWENYSGGVIGSFGFAWWARDDDAAPFSTDGNPYNEVDQADIDALAALVLQYQTHATGYIRFREDLSSPWQMSILKTNVVPEPSTWMLLGTGLIGMLGYGWRRKMLAEKAT
jgi:hypothetical protein